MKDDFGFSTLRIDDPALGGLELRWKHTTPTKSNTLKAHYVVIAQAKNPDDELVKEKLKVIQDRNGVARLYYQIAHITDRGSTYLPALRSAIADDLKRRLRGEALKNTTWDTATVV